MTDALDKLFEELDAPMPEIAASVREGMKYAREATVHLSNLRVNAIADVLMLNREFSDTMDKLADVRRLTELRPLTHQTHALAHRIALTMVDLPTEWELFAAGSECVRRAFAKVNHRLNQGLN